MMPATPQRPVPGGYIQTPAPGRQPLFRAPSTTNGPAPQTQPVQETQQQQGNRSLEPVERASGTINLKLDQEKSFPDLEGYISQGVSSDYDLPSAATAWAPFQMVSQYKIPEQVLEQFNRAQVSTVMGLFAEIQHAWVSIDNALYLWDYTNPHPELIGFEEQPNSITAVKLVRPRPGVFVKTITHLLVVATNVDIFLIGVAHERSAAGVNTVSLYQTKMQCTTRGIDVGCIEGSPKSGRIFFSVRSCDDVYEMTYQQEEGWFANKCAKVNHTTKGLQSIVPLITWPGQKTTPEYVVQMAVDDTRNLLYTLSSMSTVKVYHLATASSLNHVITRVYGQIVTSIGHMVTQSDLVNQRTTRIVSVSPVPATESSKLSLMLVNSTGCRIFMSATASGGFSSTDTTNAPSSMQVHHVRFPPNDPMATQNPPPAQSNAMTPYQAGSPTLNTTSNTLTILRSSSRYSPGYFLAFVAKAATMGRNDALFVSAPDTARIARMREERQNPVYAEFGTWLPLESRMEDVGRITPAFNGATASRGFGNELAVQYDQTATEIAILTNTGIHTIRRRRLVDVFAAAIRQSTAEEGLEDVVRKFVKLYGRAETAATALAVWCGQALDVNSDARIANITDPDIIENAKKAFIEHGGKPVFDNNMATDANTLGIDLVRPSPRHDGMALYIARLMRSAWNVPVIREALTPTGGMEIIPTVQLAKLQGIQRDLTKLQDNLNQNRSYIEGLSGPERLNNMSNKNEETALQGEHRAMNALMKLIENIIEGISFVLVLFDEKVTEIVLSLPDQSRQRVRELTFQILFTRAAGKDLAKELVKAIVNRNIAAGSNVDTVAEALRRRCGSFCSADDVVIFKAQEQLKKASESGANSDSGRMLLNESLKLFEKVAGSLSMEALQWAVEQYIPMQFYAGKCGATSMLQSLTSLGSIRLVLKVAHELDRANRALSWIKDGSPVPVRFLSCSKCCPLTIIRMTDKPSLKSVNVVTSWSSRSQRL